MADNYWSNLVSSFEEGGVTPFQALFGISEDSDPVKDFFSSQSKVPSQWAAILGDESAQQYYSDKFSGDFFIGPSAPDSLYDFFEYFNDKVSEYVEKQNIAAQSSADRAMDFSREMFQQERDFNSAEAAKDRAFQAEQNEIAWNRYLAARGSEYQTAMEDMKKAGLNPKLVAKLGGASTSMAPSASGSQASVSAPSGISANMSMANLSSLSNVLSTYISGADALDRQQNDFVKDSIQNIFDIFKVFVFLASRGSSSYLPF